MKLRAAFFLLIFSLLAIAGRGSPAQTTSSSQGEQVSAGRTADSASAAGADTSSIAAPGLVKDRPDAKAGPVATVTPVTTEELPLERAAAPGTTPYTILVTTLAKDVDPGMAALVSRSLQEGKRYDNPYFVFEIDTFGGRVDSALEIVDSLVNESGGAPTLAFVKTKAISAGALISLACKELAMRPHTSIGDCAPIAMTDKGMEILGEKVQSPLRAKFRALAKRAGYPEALAESMVSPDMVVYEVVTPDGKFYFESHDFDDQPESFKKSVVSKKTVVKEGELLTMTDEEAKEFGFSTMSVDTLEAFLKARDVQYTSIVQVEESWSEALVRFIDRIAPILLMIGFAGIYIEMKTPGFGVFGIVGVLCLGLVFFSQYMVGLADHTELLILLAGVVFLGAELFITPGFGALGIIGIGLIAVAMVMSFQGFVLPAPEMPWEQEILEQNLLRVFGSIAGSVLLIFIFFWQVFPRLSQVVPGPYLSATLAGTSVRTEASAAISVSARGIVEKPLRPSGTVRIGDRSYDVVTEGEFIEKGAPVFVLEVEGNRIVVARDKDNEQ